ncbi:MAG: alpha/beta fold hydrolase [Candidatus Diapherotrites archaeon]
MNAIIFHGNYGSPNKNWIPWLKNELEKNGWTVFSPEFPGPEKQSLASWTKAFKEYKKELNENTVLIGHSLGAAFILSILEKNNKKVKACFFVAPFISLLNKIKFDEINKTFTEKEFNWKKIKENCGEFFVIYSDTDPHVPIEKANELSEKLGCEKILVHGAGHFNEKAGYLEFPFLLKKIEELKK